jgi:hypothetical protein
VGFQGIYISSEAIRVGYNTYTTSYIYTLTKFHPGHKCSKSIPIHLVEELMEILWQSTLRVEGKMLGKVAVKNS